MSHTIIHADSADAEHLMSKDSVDLILTDIPYVVSRKNNFDTMGRTGIDFGEWDHVFDMHRLYPFIDFLRPGGSVVIFHSFQQCGEVELAFAGMNAKDKLFWQKNNPQPRNVNRRYVPDVEMISWFVKPGKKWVFNKSSQVKYHRTIMHWPIPTQLKKFHPTAKPVGLLMELISRHSNLGDLIFDPFAGSFTTVVAASRTGRSSIAFEMNEGYYNKGRELLTKEKVEFEEI